MNRIIQLFRFSLAVVGLMALTITPSRSQLIIQLGGGFGVAIPTSDFSGSTIDYYSGSHYGLTSGLNLDGKAKIGWSGLMLAAEIDYASFHNSGSSEPGQGSLELSQNVLSLRLGPEIRIGLPELPVTSYIGANLAMNKFNGETKFQGVSNVPSGTYSEKGTTRFGVGFSAGTEVSFSPTLSLDFNISYNVMNAFSHEWDDVNPGLNQRIDSYLSLNDDRDPQFTASDDKHFISKQRSIRSIVFTASILFGL
jgi:opacity protein-like surface antigen